MPIFQMRITATAEIEETWEIEAPDEATARAAFDDEEEHFANYARFVSDRTLGEERDRVLESVEPVAAWSQTEAGAPSLMAALAVLHSVDFSPYPGLYDAVPWQMLEEAA